MVKKLEEKISGFPSYMRDWIKTFRGKITIVCLIGLSLIPLLTQNQYYIGMFLTFMIYTIFAASWDFLAGFVGQVSFGHAIFLGVSGYVTAYTIVNFNLVWWLALLIGALIAVLFGLIVGIPALRLKGPYLALGTLAMSLILFQVFMMGTLSNWWEGLVGTDLFGTNGISKVPSISQDPAIEYIFTFLIMCSTLLILTHITKSNTGTIFKAIRDDETGAEASGINITKYKIYAFMISGFFAGIAGGLFVMRFRGVNPGIFQPLYSFYAIIIVAIGGIATISGSAIGAFIFVFSGELLRETLDLSLLIFSIILILFVRFAEHGLLKPTLERIQELWDIILGR